MKADRFLDKNKIVDELIVYLFTAFVVFWIMLKFAMRMDEAVPLLLKPIVAIFAVLQIDASDSPWQVALVACLLYAAIIWCGMKVYYIMKEANSSDEKDSSQTKG